MPSLILAMACWCAAQSQRASRALTCRLLQRVVGSPTTQIICAPQERLKLDRCSRFSQATDCSVRQNQWNYDLSFEWYFDRVGSLSISGFYKDIKGIVNGGAVERNFTSPSGVSTSVLVNGPVNSDGGKLKGVEISYQQTYDFLPSILSGLGSQLTYTYVDAGDFNNSNLGAEQSPFTGGLPLAGVSKHTINAVAFYEKGPLSARVAYNWRSDFLQTPRDVIFPFSPIYGEATGQLDGSIFVTVVQATQARCSGRKLA